jgi:hypothetical protein
MQLFFKQSTTSRAQSVSFEQSYEPHRPLQSRLKRHSKVGLGAVVEQLQLKGIFVPFELSAHLAHL